MGQSPEAEAVRTAGHSASCHSEVKMCVNMKESQSTIEIHNRQMDWEISGPELGMITFSYHLFFWQKSFWIKYI